VASLEWRETESGVQPFLVRDDGTASPATWAPQPGSQERFLACRACEALYEGTRGPGKTDCLLMDFAQHCGPEVKTAAGERWSGWGAEWRGILFRQTYPQLSDVIAKTQKWFPLLFPGAKYNRSSHVWTWPTGESLRLAYGAKEADYWQYHGHAFSWIGFEELTTWPDPRFFLKMISCCRSTMADMPRKIRATTNPYGPGHNWVKRRYHLPTPPGRIEGDLVQEAGEPERIAIHGHLDENRILLTADPDYKDRLRSAARSPAELDAWLHGSWDIVAGGMFDDLWDQSVHVVPDFQIPRTWRIDRSFDWGSSAPFSVGWWAESDGTPLVMSDGRQFHTVRGDLFRFAEWYGTSGQPNEGIRMSPADIAQGIVDREKLWGIHDRVKPGPADPAIWTSDGSPSIAAMMSKNGVSWIRAKNARQPGWEAVRLYLRQSRKPPGEAMREKPGLFVCSGCKDFRRLFPVTPRSERIPDDVDTTAEDHIQDETRYRVMASGTRVRGGRVVGL